jgi:hypothetical protein
VVEAVAETTEPRIWIAKDDAALFGPYTKPSGNRRIARVPAEDSGNPLKHAILVFLDNDERRLNLASQPIILYKNHWYKAEFGGISQYPYLGLRRDDIHAYDDPPTPEPESPPHTPEPKLTLESVLEEAAAEAEDPVGTKQTEQKEESGSETSNESTTGSSSRKSVQENPGIDLEIRQAKHQVLASPTDGPPSYAAATAPSTKISTPIILQTMMGQQGQGSGTQTITGVATHY